MLWPQVTGGGRAKRGRRSGCPQPVLSRLCRDPAASPRPHHGSPVDDLEADPRHRITLLQLLGEPTGVLHHKLCTAPVSPAVTNPCQILDGHALKRTHRDIGNAGSGENSRRAETRSMVNDARPTFSSRSIHEALREQGSSVFHPARMSSTASLKNFIAGTLFTTSHLAHLRSVLSIP
jgi:hypothetical protein